LEKPKVVFLHGFLESKEMWQHLNLENMFTCFFPDLLGHGSKSLREENYSSIRMMAEEVLDELKSLGWTNFHVVGHSMGGYVALELAQLIEVQSIVLMHSNFWQDSEQKKKDRERVAVIAAQNSRLYVQETFPHLFIQPESHPEFVAQALNIAKNMKGENIVLASLAMRNRKDFTAWVHAHPEKVVFIQGEKDPIIPLEYAIDHAGFLDHFYVLEDCGHMGHVESKEGILAILSQCID
jgi:pimeloyl-ACP methyl ester carboxylesterase